MKPFRVLPLALAAVLAVAAPAAAQSGGVRLQPARVDTNGVHGGDVITAVFPVANSAADTAHVVPAIDVPAGWTVVMGTAPFTLAPGAHDTWLVSVSAPAQAPAGRYVVHAALTAQGATVADSVLVRVRERRGVDVLPLHVPGWTMAGRAYDARFLVRNTGNVAANLVLVGHSSRGLRTTLDTTRMTLAPGASSPLAVRVVMTDSVSQTTTDVLEVTAADRADTATHATASVTTTVVPGDGGMLANLSTLPAQLSLRAVNGAAGLAPAALTGSGTIAGTHTHVDFSLQAPAARQSAYGFGERQQYQISVTSDDYRLRLGDQLYGLTDLTSSGQLGTGVELARTGGFFHSSAYVQHMRFTQNAATEEGVAFGTTPLAPASLSAAMVARQNPIGGGVHVASLSGRTLLPGGAGIDFETAVSDSAHRAGHANSARVTGNTRGVDYNVGYEWSDAMFAGPTRGSMYEDAHMSYRAWRDLTLSANASLRAGSWQPTFGQTMTQRMGTASIGASYAGKASLEYGWLARRDQTVVPLVDGLQRGLRASGSLPAGPLQLSVNAEHGVVDDALAGRSHDYSSVQVSARTNLGAGRSLSVYAGANGGRTLGGVSGMVSTGAYAQFALPHGFDLGLNGSAQRQNGFVGLAPAWFGQVDAHVEYRLPNRSTVGLHARVWATPGAGANVNSTALYLELRTPVGIPTGPSRQPGRAVGRIVDAITGAPVPGALVRMGTQASVSDDQGRVAFSALQPAVYHVALDASGAAAGAVLTGDVVVDTRHATGTPVKFQVAVARGGEVRVAVQRFDFMGGTLEASADSLVAAAPMSDVIVALSSAGDTLYQTTDARGRLDFSQVAPGHYTLSVLPCAVPEHHVFESRELAVEVKPGASRVVQLRVVPQQRAVTFVSGGGMTLTVKPSNKQNKDPKDP